MSVPKPVYLTVERYLAEEERAALRHEYVDGRIFAMTGVTRRHNIIAGNIYSMLRAHVRGSRCRAYISDVKVHVESTNSFYYPDVMVSCDAYGAKTVFTDCPLIIVEVLSRSTAAIDRREKVLAYRKIESLREYLIVHQRKRQVELHRRTGQGWEVLEIAAGAQVVLDSMPVGPCVLSIDQIYEDIDWAEENNDRVREGTEEITNLEESYEEGALDW